MIDSFLSFFLQEVKSTSQKVIYLKRKEKAKSWLTKLDDSRIQAYHTQNYGYSSNIYRYHRIDPQIPTARTLVKLSLKLG